MKIEVKTLFDCSTTGTTGNFRPSQMPYRDRANNEIRDHASWVRSRNQQRNWETLLQVLGLRCQIDAVEPSRHEQGAWYFTFDVDNLAVYGDRGDLALLHQDCDGVPMVTNLDQPTPAAATLKTHGPDQNIWFTAVNN